MEKMATEIKWNAGLYDDKHAFVFKYGEALVDLLQPLAGERILDLGCGTGVLARLIADRGASVTGIDLSESMISKAKVSYPDLDFRVMSATDFHFEQPFDAVFSNATLHWVTDATAAVRQMYENLKPGGRLVLEMGGRGNVQLILSTLQNRLRVHGWNEQARRNIFYFPSLSEYSGLLEQQGFRVTFAAHFDRETELKDSETGMADWLQMFCGAYLNEMEPAQADAVLVEVQEELKPVLFHHGKWWADYKRLRVIAIKP